MNAQLGASAICTAFAACCTPPAEMRCPEIFLELSPLCVAPRQGSPACCAGCVLYGLAGPLKRFKALNLTLHQTCRLFACYLHPTAGVYYPAFLGLSLSSTPVRLLPVPVPRCRCIAQRSPVLITFTYCTQARKPLRRVSAPAWSVTQAVVSCAWLLQMRRQRLNIAGPHLLRASADWALRRSRLSRKACRDK